MTVSRSNFLSILVVIAMWSITLTFSETYYWGAAAVATVMAMALVLDRNAGAARIDRSDTMIVFGLLFVLVIQMMWGTFHDFYNFREVLSVAAGVLFALVVSKVRVSEVLAWIPFYATALLWLYNLQDGIDPQNLLERNSRNFLSVVLLGLFASAIVISKPRYVTKNHYVAAALLIVISIYGIGRSGIISSTLLMALLIAKGMLDGTMGVSKAVRNTAIVVVGGLLLVTVADALVALAPRLVSRGFHDFSRMSINIMYFYKITPAELILGRNYYDITFMHKFNYNLHNSYLAAWANIGILYVAAIGYCLFQAFIKRKRFPFLWIVLLCLALRAATDIQMLGAKYDYIFLTVLFLGRNSEFLFEPPREGYRKRKTPARPMRLPDPALARGAG